ncbi:hypothetical protein KY290_021795 [Solanum tuberosum]|uniref:Uncharacterized protein n=1 Tax=Solanum tuberosum TaxID=4113 RepID=A0ABQ7V4M7_SOLTU|nr:hypothetical protein KY289_020960 [Solanum tuberosum]KAH0693587.1 hypothetical protein KY285_020684 [Solanum tuberosum]KAH0758302.1 hypothetical protein KY290_021795 [Solanum tuberosum]
MSNNHQNSTNANQSHPLNNTPIYATSAPPTKRREDAIVVQNPAFLAQVVGKGMRLAMKAYNTHVWME